MSDTAGTAAAAAAADSAADAAPPNLASAGAGGGDAGGAGDGPPKKKFTGRRTGKKRKAPASDAAPAAADVDPDAAGVPLGSPTRADREKLFRLGTDKKPHMLLSNTRAGPMAHVKSESETERKLEEDRAKARERRLLEKRQQDADEERRLEEERAKRMLRAQGLDLEEEEDSGQAAKRARTDPVLDRLLQDNDDDVAFTVPVNCPPRVNVHEFRLAETKRQLRAAALSDEETDDIVVFGGAGAAAAAAPATPAAEAGAASRAGAAAGSGASALSPSSLQPSSRTRGGKSFIIRVQPLTSAAYVYRIGERDAFAQLRMHHGEKTNVPMQFFKLLYNDKEIFDEQTPADVGITKDHESIVVESVVPEIEDVAAEQAEPADDWGSVIKVQVRAQNKEDCHQFKMRFRKPLQVLIDAYAEKVPNQAFVLKFEGMPVDGALTLEDICAREDIDEDEAVDDGMSFEAHHA